MQRFVTYAGAAALLALAAPMLSAQVVPVHQEPHHKVLLYTNFLRIFDVTIPAGQATLDHSHDHDMATVAFVNAATRSRKQGEDWGAPRVEPKGALTITEYTGMPVVHRVENTGTSDYRSIAVENNRERGWVATPPMMAPGTSVNREGRAFIVYDVRLNAGTPSTHHAHTGSVVLVLLDGVIENGGIGGEVPFRIRQPGQWIVLAGAGQAHDLSTADNADTYAVEIEVR